MKLAKEAALNEAGVSEGVRRKGKGEERESYKVHRPLAIW